MLLGGAWQVLSAPQAALASFDSAVAHGANEGVFDPILAPVDVAEADPVLAIIRDQAPPSLAVTDANLSLLLSALLDDQPPQDPAVLGLSKAVVTR